MILRVLKTLSLVALSAPPFLLLIAGCAFREPTFAFDAGEGARTDVIFCNIEIERDCATDVLIPLAVDLSNQVEDGFYSQKAPSRYGLDRSSAATSACGGTPKVATFKGTFPDGSAVCLNAPTTLGNGRYASVTAACKAWCETQGGIDDDGNEYNCNNVAWAATGAEHDPVPNACTEAGTLRADFLDLRRIRPKYVTWRDKVNVKPETFLTVLQKESTTDDWDAGAASVALLAGGDGYVEFIAPEPTTERVVGFAVGALDFDPSHLDITFGVYLRNGDLVAYESGIEKSAAVPYATGATIRVAIVDGFVQYSLNGKVFHATTSPLSYPLRVSAAFRSPGATIALTKTTF